MILRMRFSALDLLQNHEKLGPFKVYYVDIFAVLMLPPHTNNPPALQLQHLTELADL